MQNTIDLLNKALQQQTISQWARAFNVAPSALTNARTRGRLSPVLAGNFAMKLGENPQHWIAVAALEAEPESEGKRRLIDRITTLYDVVSLFVVFFQRPRFSWR